MESTMMFYDDAERTALIARWAEDGITAPDEKGPVIPTGTGQWIQWRPASRACFAGWHWFDGVNHGTAETRDDALAALAARRRRS